MGKRISLFDSVASGDKKAISRTKKLALAGSHNAKRIKTQ